ncbi:MAG: thioredoxin domain-containing protein [Myxococcota bacterium]|nr:thioredoxin domain-containing protein [Myxococcota bacterium]
MLPFATPAAEAGAQLRVPASLPGAPPFPQALRAALDRGLAQRGPGYEPRTRNLRPDGSPTYTNRLLLEASPYLQQHAHNPVNWHPWGAEAFETARRLDRPVLVSIGYSTCHWCHVMEEECFDSPEIAARINETVVPVKVDREVRPDIDAVYMSAIQALNGSGGWPLNVWLTPQGEPFFAGTYFPPEDRPGRPGLPSVLRSVAEVWTQDRERVSGVARELSAAVRRDLAGAAAMLSSPIGPGPLRAARDAYARNLDPEWGGLGSAQKFPATLPIRFLLRMHRRTGDPQALHMATLTLEKMASGGIHDQVGGGFHRYTTERRWLVPHFEKMLYDNALRVVEYLEAWQVTGRAEFAEAARRTLAYVSREMTAPVGGFYSATDADSRRPDGEMEEGWFFTWTPAEIRQALEPADAAAAVSFWGVSEEGNFEGRTVLHAWRSEGEVAEALGIPVEELRRRLERARKGLRAARSRRSPPLRDDKILVAWNGLMISAFARAGFAWQEGTWTDAAARAARFLLRELRRDGRLLRVYQDGRVAGPAFLEDYAYLVAGLLDLFEADPDPLWLREALSLQAVLDAHYADDTGGAYFRTADDGESLLVREKPGGGGALPAGNAVAAENLLRLAEFTGDLAHAERAELLFASFREALVRRPTAHPGLLLALEHSLDRTKEVVVVAPADAGGGLDELIAPLRRSYVPNRIVVVATEGPGLAAQAEAIPLLRGKTAQRGRATAYVCENGVCAAPTSDPALFEKQIRKVRALD